jgi:hypothetical protein
MSGRRYFGHCASECGEKWQAGMQDEKWFFKAIGLYKVFKCMWCQLPSRCFQSSKQTARTPFFSADPHGRQGRDSRILPRDPGSENFTPTEMNIVALIARQFLDVVKLAVMK